MKATISIANTATLKTIAVTNVAVEALVAEEISLPSPEDLIPRCERMEGTG